MNDLYMLIATFVEGETQAQARVIHQSPLRGVDDPDEVDYIPINNIGYRVVHYVPNPAHPAYLFLVRPEEEVPEEYKRLLEQRYNARTDGSNQRLKTVDAQIRKKYGIPD